MPTLIPLRSGKNGCRWSQFFRSPGVARRCRRTLERRLFATRRRYPKTGLMN